MDIHGRTALVTGGAKRVGREIAMELARHGADIVLHYNSSVEEAAKTSADIKACGVGCALVQADLARAEDIRAMVRKVYTLLRSVDILVNSASVFYKTPVKSVKESDWDKLVDTNLKGPFLLSTEIGRYMVEGSGGKIINIADWSGFRPYKDYSPYCVSKGGLLTLTKTLARDFAPRVSANAVAPGPVLRPPDMTEEESEGVVKKTLLGRWGSPADIAHAVRFLIESDFINGTVLVVDGGRSIV